jgi:hypothetical protein
MTEPWWNDQDKVGGAVATTLLLGFILCVVILALGVCAKVAIWILT